MVIGHLASILPKKHSHLPDSSLIRPLDSHDCKLYPKNVIVSNEFHDFWDWFILHLRDHIDSEEYLNSCKFLDFRDIR